MKHKERIDEVRRRLLQAALAMPGIVLVGRSAAASYPAAPAFAAGMTLEPTPACDDGDDDPTPAQIEGPYFKTRSPQRSSLFESGMAGTRLIVSGLVLTTACKPIPQAKLDFWQADDAGAYDNSSFRLRGHQFTDANGRFTLETIVPGLYPGRTRHIHVKVQAPNAPVLTTQVYFPGEPRNGADRIYSSRLLMAVQDTGNSRAATFNFVLNT